MVCSIRRSEIWGGARNVDQDVDLDVCTSGLTGSIYSKASDGDAGGDIYFLSVCGEDKLTRFVVADVRGHGGYVKQLSECVYESFQEYMHTLDGGQALAGLNTSILRYGFDAITTAALAGFRLGDSKLCFAYAGHPPMLLERADSRRWLPLLLDDSTDRSNLPLGVLAETRYDQADTSLASGDRLLLYTDGVVECSDADGVEFGVEHLLRSLEISGDQSLAEIKRAVVDELRNHSANWPSEDDITLMAFEVR
ncbi:MAG: PP2C family protein-serine/threonine phosphatase [Terracidiphilus sp.]|nr:PP2C family protein-serine/threonine phosphatase [Terracidiphilus sp.]